MSNVNEIKSLIRARFNIGMIDINDIEEIRWFVTELARGYRREKMLKLQEERDLDSREQ